MSAQKPSPLISSPSQGEDQGGGYVTYTHRPRDRQRLGLSQHLRKHMTDAENKLWLRLKRRQLGVKFRRQYVIGKYIADFACLEKKLVIELDGGQHAWRLEPDRKRDAYLQENGYTVIRFWNHDIIKNMDGALQIIGDLLTAANPHPPLPLTGGGSIS